ncbi:MAG: B12-binding domain-containing radical SAM protein, partial [Longimicrobiales bacterium]
QDLLLSLDGGRQVINRVDRKKGAIAVSPSYRTLAGRYAAPMLRLNASHGCLYACAFCGDAWSRKLYLVEPEALEQEVSQFERYYPQTTLIYIGDKTFGQSRDAVANLKNVFRGRPRYRFIVQTHIRQVDEQLVSDMTELGVVAVEMGFETADSDLLRASRKGTLPEQSYDAVLDLLNRARLKVVLNVLGGLPHETATSHSATLRRLREWRQRVWLYNLYNFVPYPLTPYFAELKPRIFNWNFSDWREDAPPVFTPYHHTPEESWSRFLQKVEAAHHAIGVHTAASVLAAG